MESVLVSAPSDTDSAYLYCRYEINGVWTGKQSDQVWISSGPTSSAFAIEFARWASVQEIVGDVTHPSAPLEGRRGKHGPPPQVPLRPASVHYGSPFEVMFTLAPWLGTP